MGNHGGKGGHWVIERRTRAGEGMEGGRHWVMEGLTRAGNGGGDIG